MQETPIHWHSLANAPAPGHALCLHTALVDGQVAHFSFGQVKDAFRLLVLRSGEAVLGYVNRCAHFGVPLANEPAQLIFTPHQSLTCNVHYARYRWQDGVCEAGDCVGEALIAVPIKVADGVVCIGG